MRKVFVIVGLPIKGAPILEIGDNVSPLLEKAKAVRASGLFGKEPCSEVHVLSSQNFGALRYRCQKAAVKAKSKASE